MTCCKGFLNLERECLDLSFTSYEIQVYERLCNGEGRGVGGERSEEMYI